MRDVTAAELGAERVLKVVDSHTCGQPTRVVVDGLPLGAGLDPADAREQLRTKHDWVRRITVLEPRGHGSMFTAALLAPADPGGTFGVVFMDAGGYPDMCGHATIGVATTLLRLGKIQPSAGESNGSLEFGLRTPAGEVALRATLRGGIPEAVAFQAPLAYYLGSTTLPTPAGGRAAVHVAYGGQWYAFIEAAAFGLTVAPERINELVAEAARVRPLLRKGIATMDMGGYTKAVPDVGNVVWHAPPSQSKADARNVPISTAGAFDRSPCGTATCARLAILHATGALTIGEPFVNEGLLGTTFRGRLVAEIASGDIRGVVPEVEGSAWLTGRAELWMDTHDPLARGFVIGGGQAVA